MRAEKVVAGLLSADAGLAALVGTKIYGGIAPERETAPLVVYRKLAGERQRTVDSPPTTVVTAAVEVLAVAKTYAGLKDVAEAIRLALLDKQGSLFGVTVQSIEATDEGPDEWDPTQEEFFQTWAFSVVHSE